MEATESPAQAAARMRREKREAKIRESGNDRLERITGLNSGRRLDGAYICFHGAYMILADLGDDRCRKKKDRREGI